MQSKFDMISETHSSHQGSLGTLKYYINQNDAVVGTSLTSGNLSSNHSSASFSFQIGQII